MSQAIQNFANRCPLTQPSKRQRRRNPQAYLINTLLKQAQKRWDAYLGKTISTQLKDKVTNSPSSEQEIKLDIFSKPLFKQKVICINHDNSKHSFYSWSYKIQVGNIIIGVQILSNSSLELTELQTSNSEISRNLIHSCILYCKNESKSSYNKFLFAFLVFQNIRQIILNRLQANNTSTDSIHKSLSENLSHFFIDINKQITFWNNRIVMKIEVSSDFQVEKDPFLRSQNELGPFLSWPRYCEYYISKNNALDWLLFSSQQLGEIKKAFREGSYGRIICSYIRNHIHEIFDKLLKIFFKIKDNNQKHPILNEYTLWRQQILSKLSGREKAYAQAQLNRYWMMASFEQLKKLIRFIIEAVPLYEDKEQADNKGLFVAAENNMYNFWKALKRLNKIYLKLSKIKQQRLVYFEEFIIACLNRFLMELQYLKFKPSSFVSVISQKKIIFLVISYAHISKIISQQYFKTDIHYTLKEKIIQKLKQVKKAYEKVILLSQRKSNYQESLNNMKSKWSDLDHFCEVARMKGQLLQDKQEEEVNIYIFLDIVEQDIVECQSKAATIKAK